MSYVSDSEICSMTFNILAESLAHLFPLFIRIGNQYNHSSASPFRNQFASHTGKLCIAIATPSIAYAVDVISLAWSGILVCLPSIMFRLQFLLKIRLEDWKIFLIAPTWLNQTWFPDPCQHRVQDPFAQRRKCKVCVLWLVSLTVK